MAKRRLKLIKHKHLLLITFATFVILFILLLIFSYHNGFILNSKSILSIQKNAYKIDDLNFDIPKGWWISEPYNVEQNKNIRTIEINPFSMDECCWDWGPAIHISHILNSTIDIQVEKLLANDGFEEKFKNQKIERFKVNDRNAIKFTAIKHSDFIGEDIYYEDIYIQNEDDVYIITSDSFRFTTTSNNQKQIIEQLLNSLKFTN